MLRFRAALKNVAAFDSALKKVQQPKNFSKKKDQAMNNVSGKKLAYLTHV